MLKKYKTIIFFNVIFMVSQLVSAVVSRVTQEFSRFSLVKISRIFITIVFALYFLLGIQFTASAQVCEATGAAECYYLSASVGSDTIGDGSYENPWQSFKNIISYYDSSFRPINWIAIKPGDYIYLLDGEYSQVMHPGDGSGVNGGEAFVAYFRTLNGDSNNWFHVKAYPGAKPVINPGYLGGGIKILQSGYWEISGITVKRAQSFGESGGISLSASNNIKVSEVEIYDTDGTDNNNIAGLNSGGSREVEIYNSIFHDNYDRTNTDTNGKATANSSNMVFFAGANVSVHNNIFYQSPPLTADKSGVCLKYKHAQSDSEGYFKVFNNIFYGCKFSAIMTGTQNSHIYNNLIYNSDYAIQSLDLGGPTHQNNQIFEYNTIYNSRIFSMNPTDSWSNDVLIDPKNIVFQNNIAYETRTALSNERATLIIGIYQSDALYDKTVPELHIDNNCYYNPNSLLYFNLFSANNDKFNSRPQYGVKGASYNFSDWQNFGFDQRSIVSDPLFLNLTGDLSEVSDFRLTENSICKNLSTDGSDVGANIDLLGVKSGMFCTDGTQNQNETEIDCGGVCDACDSDPDPTPIIYNLSNFISLIDNWLTQGNETSDINSDSVVNTRDLGIMMSSWGN